MALTTTADTLIGTAGDDVFLSPTGGLNAGDVVDGGEGIDTIALSEAGILNASGAMLNSIERLEGSAGNDVIVGSAGNIIIDGGTGADVMIGWSGNDTYIVDNAGDVVIEFPGDGVDELRTSIAYALPENIERIVLIGNADVNLTGNAASNTLIGNVGSNILDGGIGADTLIGGGGNDVYVVDDAGDVVTELDGEGTDEVRSSVSYTLGANIETLTLTGDSAINGTGNDAANTINGNSASNVLDGGVGADTMIGGGGNDVYIVDNAEDVVTELANEGTDEVQASLSYTLGANLENLILRGTSAINGTGNDATNTIIGNSAGNILDGGAGADTLSGGAGDDVYLVDNAGDVVLENPGDGVDEVRTSIAYALPENIERIVLIGNADVNLTGNAASNTLIGNVGSNILDGGIGADTLIGGGGNDVYVVDDAGDVVTELDGEGTDEVRSSVSYTLGANIETLTLTGDSAINGTGNDAANTINGNSASNVLDGGVGADTMIGGGGNDVYIVDNAEDVVTELANEGTDEVQASLSYTLGANLENLILRGTSAINGTGNDATNTIIGNSAGNILDGGAGADTLSGGAGDDVYLVDNAGDVVLENPGDGVDELRTSLSYTLGANIEILTLTGTSTINGTGNTIANTINGNSAANVLDGGAGADQLAGGGGNDIYIVDNAGDIVTEALNAGTDEVRASLSYTLGANVESLTLTGTSAINGTGNSSANIVIGNTGVNILDGGAGADTLIGSAGNDVYIVDHASDTVLELINEGTDEVRASIAYTLTANVEILRLTGTGNLNGTGNTLANTLIGTSGNNTLNGGGGADTLIGGVGNDVYIIDNTGDVITEDANAGRDEAQASVSFTLAANVEILTLTGSSALNGTGNSLANTLHGNIAINTLNGGAGADILIGYGGDDIYIVDDIGDVPTETLDAGRDTVQSSIVWTLGANLECLTLTGSSAINGTGNGLGNILFGNSAANTLDGGVGVDSMAGGGGDDLYIVDDASDITIETLGAGMDEVRASVSYTLSDNIERLILTGLASINGFGNAIDNVLIGNTADNLLDGGNGNDVMTGGSGNDLFVFTSGADTITDFITGTADDRIDLHAFTSLITFSSVMALTSQVGANTLISLGSGNTLTLQNVQMGSLVADDFVLFSPGAVNTGSAAADSVGGSTSIDTIDGLAGNDVIDGHGGGDTISGGEGDDTIYYYASDDASLIYGGTGSDTLMVIGGSPPRSFALGAQGFEFARHEQADTGQVGAWSTISDLYNASWQLMISNSVFDDGSRVSTTYDRGVEVWSIITDEFNTVGGRVTQRIYNDENSYRFFYWDPANTQNWKTFDDEFTSAGLRWVERIQYDTGASRYYYWDTTNTESWSTFDEEYTPTGERWVQRILNDSGATSQQFWDVDHAQSWSTLIDYYNAAGQRTQQSIVNDDASYRYITYDVTNSNPWQSRTQIYSAAGVLISDATIAD